MAIMILVKLIVKLIINDSNSVLMHLDTPTSNSIIGDSRTFHVITLH